MAHQRQPGLQADSPELLHLIEFVKGTEQPGHLTDADGAGHEVHQPKQRPAAVQLQREVQDAAEGERHQRRHADFLNQFMRQIRATAVPARPALPAAQPSAKFHLSCG